MRCKTFDPGREACFVTQHYFFIRMRMQKSELLSLMHDYDKICAAYLRRGGGAVITIVDDKTSPVLTKASGTKT
jgi:hypothetical protein